MSKETDAAAKKFATLLKKIVSAYAGEDPPARDPVAQLVVGFLQWRSTRRAAEDAHAALMAELIDINDMRASHTDELVALIGVDYPDAVERVIRLKQSLHAVYVREHDVQMHSISGKGKKEQRAYLDSLYGITPYAAAQVTLLSFGGHALPVDEKLILLLEREEALPANLDAAGAEAFLLRQIKAGDAMQAHLALQAWSDKSRSKFPGSPTHLTARQQAPQVGTPEGAAAARAAADAEAETATDAEPARPHPRPRPRPRQAKSRRQGGRDLAREKSRPEKESGQEKVHEVAHRLGPDRRTAGPGVALFRDAGGVTAPPARPPARFSLPAVAHVHPYAETWSAQGLAPGRHGRPVPPCRLPHRHLQPVVLPDRR